MKFRKTYTSLHILKYAMIFVMVLSLCGCRSSKKKHDKGPDIVTVDSYEEIFKIENESPSLKKLEKKLVAEAKTWIGTPYRYGGSEKGRGTDCSGLVLRVYEDVSGIKLPRNSAKQAEFCKDISKNKVRPGDLVFFATGSDKKKVSHVGMMIDAISFVHASGSKGVIVSEMTTPYYRRNFIKFGRPPSK